MGLPVLLLFLLPWAVAPAENNACVDLPTMRQYGGSAPPATCLCDSNLLRSQVTLSLAPPFRLAAVCDLRWVHREPPGSIDLQHESVSFDDYTKGSVPFGFLLLRGHTELRGVLVYEPGPAGEYWFHLAPDSVAPRQTARIADLATLKLIDPITGLRPVPPQLTDAECWIADAVIDVRDIWLLIGDTDEAGAFPSAFRIEAATNHRDCEPAE